MARKHAKKFSKKQPVERTLVGTSERKVVMTGAGVIVIPASPHYVQGKAQGPTTTKGQKNGTDAKKKPAKVGK
jgi:hypothetical protein